MAPPVKSAVRVSSRLSAPVTVMPVRADSAWLCVTPLTVTMTFVPSLLSEMECEVSSVASTTSSPGGPRALLLIWEPVGAVTSVDGAAELASTGVLAAVSSCEAPVGASAAAAVLLEIATCAWSGVGEDTAEPSWLPLVPLLTVGALEGPAAAADTSADADVSGGGAVVSTDEVRGVTCGVRSGVDGSGGAVSTGPPPAAAIEPA